MREENLDAKVEEALSKPVREYNFAVDHIGRIGLTASSSFVTTPHAPAEQTPSFPTVPPRGLAQSQSQAGRAGRGAKGLGKRGGGSAKAAPRAAAGAKGSKTDSKRKSKSKSAKS